MLELRHIQAVIHHHALSLRRHYHPHADAAAGNVARLLQRSLIRSAKGASSLQPLPLPAAPKVASLSLFGITPRRALLSFLFMLGTLALVMGWEGTVPIASVIRYDDRLAKLLKLEAGLPIGERYVENFMPVGCDYTKGRWVRNKQGPSYNGKECLRWLAEMWVCRLNNRTDFDYENYRWQPDECDLPKFDGQTFLRRMRNKILAFVGDSLGRQQFQSLMCLIMDGRNDTEVEDVGAEFGLIWLPRTMRPDGWVYRFVDTNTTILFYWSSSLSDLVPMNKSNPRTKVFMHLDRPPHFLKENLWKFDVLILNTGHHWNIRKVNRNKWEMHVEGKRLQPTSSLNDIKNAYNFTVHSFMRWLDGELKTRRVRAFYQTLSPRHFFNGDWNTGGRCDNTRLKSTGQRLMKGPLIDEVAESAVRGTKIKLLNITLLSQFRDEAHISRYSWKFKNGTQDCLHWCLPGVPDTWNEILYAQLFQPTTISSHQQQMLRML